jgi:hypothetical protein
VDSESAAREALAEAERSRWLRGERIRRGKPVRWSELEHRLARKVLECAGQGEDQDE